VQTFRELSLATGGGAFLLWRIKVDRAKAGGSWVRLVKPLDPVLMERACANFVIRGGVRVAADLYMTAGKPAARDSHAKPAIWESSGEKRGCLNYLQITVSVALSCFQGLR
jgi:hypothetical protein